MVRALLLCLLLWAAEALRGFRPWSNRYPCITAQFPNYPFAYSKYGNQSVESKGRVNTNLQDFRHECGVRGGLSKCHICEPIDCLSETGECLLQLQGVNISQMSSNIPIVSDVAWAVGGAHRWDYNGSSVKRFCVMLLGGKCVNPYNTDYNGCPLRCFGSGFSKPAHSLTADPRTVTDVYPGMGKWEEDGEVDLWAYPRNCSDLQKYQGTTCTYSGSSRHLPSFNPQGYTFTLAGSGKAGFLDGNSTVAQFDLPSDLAIDMYGNVYVADTMNNAIRLINNATSVVTTLAGRGPAHRGIQDGPCATATFTEPQGIDVRIVHLNGTLETVVIVVADTGNHRIRRIDYIPSTGYCRVRCLSGLCGNDTLSHSSLTSKASPYSGYADGDGLYARFSAPQAVTFMDYGFIAVADSGNYLIRWVSDNGTTSTLAGSIVPGQRDADGQPLAGCQPPCMAGESGLRDGNLTHAQFLNPSDVTRGTNNTLWVTDEHRIRIIELPNVHTMLYGVAGEGRVSTIAGTSLQGHEDGMNDVATFYGPTGVFVTSDNIAYVSDSSSCRIRRITPLPLASFPITIQTRAVELVRPSGCTSFDQPTDKVGNKITRIEANYFYNFGYPNADNNNAGKTIKNCVGTPPRDKLDKHFIHVTGDNLVIDDHRTVVNEDSEQGAAIMISCPTFLMGSCNAPNTPNSVPLVFGNTWYSESSSVCCAAAHAGVLQGVLQQSRYYSVPSFVRITLQRRDYLNTVDPSLVFGAPGAYGITSGKMSTDTARVFMVEPQVQSQHVVHTVAGYPSADLEGGCGFADAQPPTLAYFNRPGGVAARPFSSLTDNTLLYITDQGNHRIRALSASCTLICENGGSCVGPDKCKCPSDWTGIDCTTPVCSTTSLPINQVCIGPNILGCKPGYSGFPACTTPLCVQNCHNNGTCSAPDTCSCARGWFDTNCTTPVCSNTCANGGNCTAPDTCACPDEWRGSDCRIPVCTQVCLNGGYCMAPNTCRCPPQWIGADCSVPVCTQGYFRANPNDRGENHMFVTNVRKHPEYRYCDTGSWCNATKEFECNQLEYTYDAIQVPAGGSDRKITGRKEKPTMCMNIELPVTYKIPYELINADNTTTGTRRFSPYSPYQSNVANAWRGYFQPTDGHTGPWTYVPDRQIANVQWVNVSQGVYVCANQGNCTAPGICECAPGWIGFDCRTPVCEQGYFHEKQKHYVSGLETPDEVTRFKDLRMMQNNSYFLQWPYSNPNYTMQWEFYVDATTVSREIRKHGGVRYNAVSNWSSGVHAYTFQGGYRCSVRAVTEWENVSYIWSHPNFYSRYMDTKMEVDHKRYTFWQNMGWPAVHQKSRILDQVAFNRTYAFTNEGWRRFGTWNRTAHTWQYGICIMEFRRNCSGDSSKELDLQSGLRHTTVQDPDLAYRPRMYSNDMQIYGPGRWVEAGGECVDHVLRGCYNNATCVAPNTCECAPYWKGYSCNIPVCDYDCNHNGKCTGPNTCTCEKGWEGVDCSIPICAQECQNNGICVAPDTCKCFTWENDFRDGRLGGGRPLFQNPHGDPLPTGWTGFDCGTPICVQAENFLYNTKGMTLSNGQRNPLFVSLGGHGGNSLLSCIDASTGKLQPRCPQYDIYVTGNEGATFQTGCGFDPYDTGCCKLLPAGGVVCYRCPLPIMEATNHTFFCHGTFSALSGLATERDKFKDFLDANGHFRICGQYHSPRYHNPQVVPPDYGIPEYYTDFLSREQYTNLNYKASLTSNRFLCNVREWEQGDYIDDAGLDNIIGAGSIYGLAHGRHKRINYPNLEQDPLTQIWKSKPGGAIAGEGIYRCYNDGSCLGPDVCSCTDGYEGVDCSTPQCRHRQPTGTVTSCLNGGICTSKDQCNCVQTTSQLTAVHPEAAKGITGWSGSDCSIPICTQGFFDPFCTDLPQAPAGEGCYRCANGGNCTAPDVCTCAPGWSGYNCKTPLCEVVADPLTRTQLHTYFEDKVIEFETDPCGVKAIHGVHGWKGRKYARGNCSEPNTCTCLCKSVYDPKACKKSGQNCHGPWQDLMVSLRNVLVVRGPEYTFGSTDCEKGYEGNVNSFDQFTTCHQTIYVPGNIEKDSVQVIVGFAIIGFIGSAAFYFINARIKQKFLLAKIERRRSKRSSEESLVNVGKSAFTQR